MNPHQQYSVKVKEESDELGIWVPVKQEHESAESVPGAFVKDEPTDHVRLFILRMRLSTHILLSVLTRANRNFIRPPLPTTNRRRRRKPSEAKPQQSGYSMSSVLR